MPIRWLLVAVSVLLVVGAAPAPASAEWFGDIYVGWSVTRDNDVDVKAPGSRVTLKDVEFEPSFAYGARLGYWFDRLPSFGLAVDVSSFKPDIDGQVVRATTAVAGLPFTVSGRTRDLDLEVVPIAFDLMLRWPLFVGPSFPQGRLQPYLALGPFLYVADMEDHGNLAPRDRNDTDVGIGGQAGAGLTFMFTKDIGIFGEYRFTHLEPEFRFSDVNVGPVKIETEVQSHHFLVGLTARF